MSQCYRQARFIFTCLITPNRRRHNEMADGHGDRCRRRLPDIVETARYPDARSFLNRYVNVNHVSVIRYGLLYARESVKQTNVLSNTTIISGETVFAESIRFAPGKSILLTNKGIKHKAL